MSPVLEVPEALCIRHGPYTGLECPACSDGYRTEHENRPPVLGTPLPI